MRDANARLALKPPGKRYRELGAVEGTAKSIDRDGRGHLILCIHHRLSGEEITCFVSGTVERKLGDRRMRDVWRGKRVIVSGMLHYKGRARLDFIECVNIGFMRDRSDLPSIDEILDSEFTQGTRSEDYLARLRMGAFLPREIQTV